MICPKCHGEKVVEYILDYRFKINGSKEQSWDIDTCGRCDGRGVVDDLTEYEKEVLAMMHDLEIEGED